MANKATKGIMTVLIEGVLNDFMPQTVADMVYVDGETTLTTKLAEILADVATRAKTTDMNSAIQTAIDALRTELMGEDVPEAYDTFKEIATYITEHKEVSDALTAAVGSKADKSAVEAIQQTVNALGALAKKDKVEETDLAEALKTKVNAAAAAQHTHANQTVLDGISAEKVTAWDGKGRALVSKTQPADLGPTDIWLRPID